MANNEKEEQGSASDEKASGHQEAPAAKGEEPAVKAEGEGVPEKKGEEPAKASPNPEEEEGWPKSWIVTTVILGIIAIIIVARLVGQSWKREELSFQGEGKGQPPGKMMPPGKGGPPGKGMPPGKGGPPPKGMPPGKPPRSPAELASPFASKLKAAALAFQAGSSCIGPDGKAYVLAKPVQDACVFKPGMTQAFRLHAVRGDTKNDAKLEVFPAKESLELVKIGLTPEMGKEIYFESTNWFMPDMRVMIVVDAKEAQKLDSFEFSSGKKPEKQIAGSVAAKTSLDGVSAQGQGRFCLGTDKKAYPFQSGEAPNAACAIPSKEGKLVRLEFERNSEGPWRMALASSTKGATPFVDVLFPPMRPEPTEYLEASLPKTASFVVVMTSEAPICKLAFKTLSVIIKK